MTKTQDRLAIRACAAALFLLAGSFSTPHRAFAGQEPQRGWFSRVCAEHDLRALAAIEQFGEIEEMSSGWLGDAGQSFLQARMHCLAGREADGIALYNRIIAGDARLSSARLAK